MNEHTLMREEIVDLPIPVASTLSQAQDITSSCNGNSIGNDVVNEQDSNSSDQNYSYPGGNMKGEENDYVLSRGKNDMSRLDYQMRSSEFNYVTGLGSHASEQVMSLGREYCRQQPYFSPSNSSWQNFSFGLESVPSNPHSSTRIVGKLRTETNIGNAKPDYLTSHPAAALNIRSSYSAAGEVDFSLEDNSEPCYTRTDRFTAFSNCNGQSMEHQNKLVDSVRGCHYGDEIPSLSSQWHFSDEIPSLSREPNYGDEIPSLSGRWRYGDEIRSLSSQWSYADEIPSLSSQQGYGDEIPSLSRQWRYRDKIPLLSSQWCYDAEVPSLSSQWQGAFRGNGYSKNKIASRVVSISHQLKMSKSEHTFTKSRMASRVVNSNDHYKMNKKNNPWRNYEDLSDQVRGPRANKMNSTSTSSAEKDVMSPLICRDHFNRSDFSIQYEHAKFFMIKSYSEDDVHKGIKYNVWASTPNGNNKLDAAFREAQVVMKEKCSKCPIFLFFSVNASGQFVGLAEMLGPVDFNKTMDFWQQDKWNGFFPLMWHIIKDIPNRHFQHITLENNDNRTVTFSRDTQEIGLPQGLKMLEIFKAYPLGTSILDDFNFYEEKENSRRALKENSQSTHEAKFSDDFKPMEHLGAGMQKLSFYGTRG